MNDVSVEQLLSSPHLQEQAGLLLQYEGGGPGGERLLDVDVLYPMLMQR